MKFRFLLIWMLALVGLFGAFGQPTMAQTKEPIGFKNVTLWLNPEYDDPRLLVMLEGKITGATTPTRVRFLVPTAAEMYSAGSKDATGKYSGGPPDRKTSDIPGWDEISYVLDTETFRVEYYDDAIIGQPDKEISYYFQFLYPISELNVMVQQPREATNFKVTPEGIPGKDGEGFNILRYSFNNLVPASPLNFNISYTRSDPNPSLNNSPISSGPDPNDTLISTNDSSALNLPLLVGTVTGIFAVVAFIFMMNRSRSQSKAVKYSKKNSRAARRRETRGLFCTQCGTALEEIHRYCANCGHKAR